MSIIPSENQLVSHQIFILCTLLSTIDFCAHFCLLQISDRGRNPKSCCQVIKFLFMHTFVHQILDFCAYLCLLQSFVHTFILYRFLCMLLSAINLVHSFILYVFFAPFCQQQIFMHTFVQYRFLCIHCTLYFCTVPIYTYFCPQQIFVHTFV